MSFSASGFTHARKGAPSDEDLTEFLLSKPYRREELAFRIRQVLDGPLQSGGMMG
jgi:hypothetical protein